MASKLKVFIGDDSALMREWLRRVLERNGDVEIVGYADKMTELPNAVRTLRPDLVILDLKTGRAGREVLRRLKKSAGAPLTVIVFSNQPSELYKNRYIEAGADYFFDRSVEQKELAQMLREVIRRHHQTKS